MKHVFKIQFLVGVFILLFASLAGATGKWSSLNLLKNVKTSEVDDGFIIRLEFEKPVEQYIDPVFFDKSVQVDFPLAYIKPAKKYFPAESFALTKVFAAQYDAETLRVRFLKKDGLDIQGSFKLASQGRFVIVRLDHLANSSTSEASQRTVEVKDNSLMSDDELSRFLAQASEKILAKGRKNVTESSEKKKIESIPQPKKTNNVKNITSVEVNRAGMGVEPIVERIRKAALPDSQAEKVVNEKNVEGTPASKKKPKKFSLKDSRPTGKPIELVPSGMKMFSMLALVLGLIFLLFFGFKKFVLKNTVFGGGEKLVNVLGSGFLGPKKNIVLVEVAGEVLVLGMSQDHIALLTSITDAEKIEEIKSAGEKGGSGLNWNQVTRTNDKSVAQAGKATEKFSSYMKQFSGSEKGKREKSVADVKEQIRQQMGRFKTARA